jgi:hypothetical protein
METKTACAILIVVVLLPLCASAQRKSQFGIMGGANLASLHSSLEVEKSPKLGYTAGIYYRFAMGDILTLRPELFYSQEGQVYGTTSQGHPNQYQGVKSTTTVHKLCTPVLIEIGRKFTADAGAQIGWMLAANNTIDEGVSQGPLRQDLSDRLTLADFSVIGGMGFHPGRHLEAGIHYNYGLNRVFQASGFPYLPARQSNFRSMVLQATIGYAF